MYNACVKMQTATWESLCDKSQDLKPSQTSTRSGTSGFSAIDFPGASHRDSGKKIEPNIACSKGSQRQTEQTG
jgi:hypothetical protein